MEGKAASTMSKRRYEAMETRLRVMVDDEKREDIMRMIREVMQYDPYASRYTPEVGQRAKDARHRIASERGVTTYVTSGQKSSYDKRRGRRDVGGAPLANLPPTISG